MIKKVFLKYTEGCCWRRLIDLKLIEHFFVSNGYTIVTSPEEADLIILETCAFVKRTEDIAIHEIENFSKKYANKMIVMGCLVGINKKRLRKIFNGTAINTANIEELNNYFPKFKNKLKLNSDVNAIFCQENVQLTKITLQAITRYFFTHLHPGLKSYMNFFRNCLKVLKINMGLNRKVYYIRIAWGCERPFCTFCVERLAVGSSVVSKPKEVCIQEVKKGLENGYKNFVIIADNPAAWRGKNGERFPDLIKAILNVNPSLIISNIDGAHPYWLLQFRKEFIELVKTGRIKSIMSSLQSGSDRILSLMNRRYTSKEYLEIMGDIKKANPDIVLITQVIAGFPSETFNEFKESIDVVIKAGMTNVTVFPYYCNPTTPSAKLPGKISDEEKFKRVRYALEKFGSEGMLCFNLGIEINPIHQKTKAIYDKE